MPPPLTGSLPLLSPIANSSTATGRDPSGRYQTNLAGLVTQWKANLQENGINLFTNEGVVYMLAAVMRQVTETTERMKNLEKTVMRQSQLLSTLRSQSTVSQKESSDFVELVEMLPLTNIDDYTKFVEITEKNKRNKVAIVS